MKEAQQVYRWLQSTGSTWMPVEELDRYPSEDLASGELVETTKFGKTYVTFPYYREMEQKIAKMVVRRLFAPSSKVSEAVITALIEAFELAESRSRGFIFRLADEQKEAVVSLIQHRFAIVTGGPGTGKTSVLKCVIYILERIFPNPVIEFTAPTGKAARRVTESTGYPATTLQRRMGDAGIEGQSLKFIRTDFLFTDEVSMLDMETFYKALCCLKEGACWYLVGDVDQLPSVGLGAILRDLIDCRAVPYVQLEKTFRQDNSSILFDNILTVKKGGHLPLQEGKDTVCIRTEDDCLRNIIAQYLEGVKTFGADNTVILTPFHKSGYICSDRLNTEIQKIMNPWHEGMNYVRANGFIFMEGDPVMQIVNTEKVANGDVGKIVEIAGKKVTVQYPDCTVVYWPDTYEQLELAYAMSIHKSQGSEYPCVILLLLREHERILDRNMVYTGITRAKKKVVVIGEDTVIQAACKRQSAWSRCTNQCEEIEETYRYAKAYYMAKMLN